MTAAENNVKLVKLLERLATKRFVFFRSYHMKQTILRLDALIYVMRLELNEPTGFEFMKVETGHERNRPGVVN